MQKSVDKDSENSLHNQWEMGLDSLDVRNPTWNKYVQKIAIKAAGELGITHDARVVKADMDRAHLWAVGACLPPYKEYVDWKYLDCFFG